MAEICYDGKDPVDRVTGYPAISELAAWGATRTPNGRPS